MQKKVLLVEDSSYNRHSLKDHIECLGYDVITANGVGQADEMLFSQNGTIKTSIGAVITAMRMPMRSGLDLVRLLRRHGAHTPCLVYGNDRFNYDLARPLDVRAKVEEFDGAEFREVRPKQRIGLRYIDTFLEREFA